VDLEASVAEMALQAHSVAEMALQAHSVAEMALQAHSVAPGAFGGRNASCFRQGAGFGGASGAGGQGSTASGSSLTGTIGQLSGNSLTITDAQGSNYVVTLNTSTKIIQFKSATASALKSGANLTITGSDDGKGGIKAQSIIILLAGSTTASGTTA